MKTDKDYSYNYFCPNTGESVTFDEHMHNHGVCHRCGANVKSTVTHAEKANGKWCRPNLIEFLKGERKYFIDIDELGGIKL